MNSPNLMTDLLGRGAEVNCVDNLDRIPRQVLCMATVNPSMYTNLVFTLLNDFADIVHAEHSITAGARKNSERCILIGVKEVESMHCDL